MTVLNIQFLASDIVSLAPCGEGVRRTGEGFVGSQEVRRSRGQYIENHPSPQPSPIGEGVNNSHPELVLGSHKILKRRGQLSVYKMLKQVQHDENSLKRTYSLINLFSYSPRKRCAFTLAEVLITVGIIGIVAAMTMPALIANHLEKERVTRLKKAYSTLSNAYISVLDEYGPPQYWDVENWDDVNNIFAKYIKNVKICKDGEKYCFLDIERKDLVNNNVYGIGGASSGASASLVMSDGIVAGVGAQVSFEAAMSCTNLLYCFHFTVDINGDKLPNQWGVDTFTFHVLEDRIAPRGAQGLWGAGLCDPEATNMAAGWINGSGCGAWVLQMGNMDYLKCVKGNKKYCGKKYYFN